MYTDLLLALLNDGNARTHGILLALLYSFCPAAAFWWISGAVPEPPQAGFLKGIGALLGGLIGGFGFSIALTLFFVNIRNPWGIAGGLVVLTAMLVGMPAKIYFMNHVSAPVLTTFILSMVIKNFGIVFMGVGLFSEASK